MLKKLHCPWLSDMERCVRESIAEYDKFIVAEAGDDKCIDFAKEAFLYKRFQDNNTYGMVWCNIEVLKYFVLFFEKKILYSMIGKCKFTKIDEELYTYFRNTKFVLDRYKVNAVLQYYNDTPKFIGEYDVSYNWDITLDTESNGIIRVNYVDFFVQPFAACNDMVRNAKHLGTFCKVDNVFDGSINLYEYPRVRLDKSKIIKF